MPISYMVLFATYNNFLRANSALIAPNVELTELKEISNTPNK